jgi:hypothetical protein
MPPPLGSFSTLLTVTAKPFAVKTLEPLSSKVLRQQQHQQNHTSGNNNAVVTERAILNSFPRPNLQPTLHSSSSSSVRLQLLKAMNPIPTCFNCQGPHSTKFCPC